MIYFDHNATTPVDPRVLEAMLPYLQQFHGNPSSLYRLGRIARTAIETAREQVASLVNCQSSQVIFTSGGTESNNLAVKGLTTTLSPAAWAAGVSEHPAILEIANALPQWEFFKIPITSEGCISTDWLENQLPSNLRLVSIMWANNETGSINDIHTIATQLASQGILLHSDAVQAIGKIPVDFNHSNAFAISISGHKIYGPKGSGALIVKNKMQLAAQLNGGGQECGIRSGTENVPAIVGLGKAAELAQQELEHRIKHYRELKQALLHGLKNLESIRILSGPDNNRHLSNTVMFACEAIDGEMLLMQLDKNAIAVSSGSACASGGREPSHVLTAMGIDAATALNAIRVSFGMSNTLEDINKLLKMLNALNRNTLS